MSKQNQQTKQKIEDIHVEEGHQWDRHIDRTLAELLRMYNTIVRPVEERFEYDVYRPSWFGETVVQKKPFILFIGPWSTGKSTFINYLMGSNVLQTGPQPVTDKFTIMLHGDELEQISGRVLVSDSNQPFRGLSQFGDSFIESLHAITSDHPILRSVSLIDTPGVLEAAGDSKKRRYDYIKVMRWFVERSDLVFFMFDPTKLDTGPELQRVFKYAMKNMESKVRIVLNKADTVQAQELMRVYGSLFWSLSTLLTSTEPPRVYVGSFWDHPYKPFTMHELFSDEKADLIYELTDSVPRQSLDRRVTTVMRRCMDVYLHALLCATVRDRLPSFFGKDKALKQQIAILGETFSSLAERHKVSAIDFGSKEEYEKFFGKIKIDDIPDLDKCKKKGWFEALQKMMNVDLPALLKPIKNAPVIDPRDRKHAIKLQQEYNQTLQRQLDGEVGLQGGLGYEATSAFRAGTLPNASTYTQPQGQPGGMGMGAEQMQMMMLMMQQQQQQQQQQLLLQQQQQQQQQQSSPVAGMSNEQMQMMMQMMQQQKSGQY